MTKILVAGDFHGNEGTPRWAENMVAEAQRHGAKRIVQCGDFGLWDHLENGIRFLDALNDVCRSAGAKVYWVDGNHENHDRLDWYLQNNPRNYTGHVYIRSHILYSPRGHRWTWDGKKFMSVGGAVSIDKNWRIAEEKKPRTLWWPGEQLTDAQVNQIESEAVFLGRVDYLFTHDCPTNAPFKFRLKNDPDSHTHRQKMDRIGKAVKPGLWFHGHMHDQYEYEFPTYQPHSKVYGLECNGMAWAWGILDTETDSFEFAS